jgi:hypothetical protein
MFLMFSWATGFWSIAIAADCPPPCDERRFISDHCASPLTSSGSLCHCPLHPPTGTLSWKLCDKGIDDLISWKMCFSEILAEKRRGQPCNSNWLQLIVLFFVWYVEANNQIKYWCAYIYCMCVYIYIRLYWNKNIMVCKGHCDMAHDLTKLKCQGSAFMLYLYLGCPSMSQPTTGNSHRTSCTLDTLRTGSSNSGLGRCEMLRSAMIRVAMRLLQSCENSEAEPIFLTVVPSGKLT